MNKHPLVTIGPLRHLFEQGPTHMKYEEYMMMKSISVVLCVGAISFAAANANAATVTCNFMSEDIISKDGVWIKKEDNFMEILKMFGQGGLKIKLQNSLLEKLDSGEVFLAGQTELGKVYLRGSMMGVSGKNIRIEGDLIRIHDGICVVSFGN